MAKFDRKQLAILERIYRENPKIVPIRRPEKLTIKKFEEPEMVITKGLYLGMFIGRDDNGKLALTPGGLRLLHSMRQKMTGEESKGGDQKPPDPAP